MSYPSLWVVDIPAQWDARNVKRCLELGRGITNGGLVGAGFVSGGMGGDSAGARY